MFYNAFEYDSKGNKIKETRYDGNQVKEYYSTIEYDPEGNKIKDTKYRADDQIDCVFEYDPVTGDRIRYISYHYNEDGSLSSYSIDEQNPDGTSTTTWFNNKGKKTTQFTM